MISFPHGSGFVFSASLLWSLWTAPVLLRTLLEGVETPEGSRACFPSPPPLPEDLGMIRDRVACVWRTGEWVCAGQEESLLAKVSGACWVLLPVCFVLSLFQSESRFSLQSVFPPLNTLSFSDSENSMYPLWWTVPSCFWECEGGSAPSERTTVLFLTWPEVCNL